MFKYMIAGISVLVLSACASPKLDGFDKPKIIERAEIIQSTKDCINARLRPVIQTLPQKTDHGTIMFPVSVHCESYSRH